ncbi:LysR family transcriptional regulator [Sulfurifustis variabilis]|uniref:LysR family transcriptional regulator n=1 Tax=Sulfurifustis variabilis TaxID=1675686 RepID=A0A1C7AFW4_9GAMM|nr:LysR family transcriptional regulator [Sulfurifustis variabilis]BAU50308.1 LysR family transcriptional regulator [Sulfurifustis variabilis]
MEYKFLPELDGWAALRAVVEKGGVIEAARVLRIGQPAVTKRLKTLEACYGVRLMERVGGRLRLTPAGEKVYLLAVQTLDRHFALREDLQSVASGQTTLRLEVTFAIGEHLLPSLLLQFSERFPDYRVNSRMGYGRRIQTRLASGVTDLALLESAPDHPDILVQKWMEDELWLVCGPQHPLAGTELLPVEQVPQLNYVLRERRSAIRDTLDEALRRIGIERVNVAMEVGSTDAIVEILSRGRHVSFLPRFAVIERVAQGRLARLKVTGFRIMRVLWIARHRANLDHPVAEAFIALLREKA